MKKKFAALTLAALLVCSLMVPSALAVGTSEETGELYTLTLDAEVMSTYATTTDSTQTASSSMGVALDPGASGWSNVVNVRFSTLPSNARVQSIKVVPGTATVNSGNSNMLGAVLPSKLTVTAPNGQSTNISWANTMTSTAFSNILAKGTWTMSFYGTNLTQPTGNSMNDLLRVGSVSYKQAKITITYTLQ